MKRASWVVLACLAAATVAAFQTNQAQPGHHRSDAPAQHELGRTDIKVAGASDQFMNPREPGPEPPLDPRVTNPIRMTDDTTSNDFPDIASNPRDRGEVWCVWQAYSG